jgi:hypothetical protein
MPIREHYPALAVHIVLRVGHPLTQLQPLSIRVLDGYHVRLIPTSPDHEIRTIHVPLLLLRGLGLNERDSLLLASHDLLVEILGVTSEAREGVKVAIFFGELVRLELIVAVFLRIGDLVVEDFDLLTV